MRKTKYFKFAKYQALGNDFLIIDLMAKSSRGIDFNDLSKKICNRNCGVGADGILVLTKSRLADCCVDLFNSDGSWAEKSGNGLRIAAAYYYGNHARRKNQSFEINSEVSETKVLKAGKGSFLIQASLGKPELDTRKIPLKSRSKYHINESLDIEGVRFPVTALSVGNPHTVMFVDNFEFDWKELGRIIENSKYFPHCTNVEFVKIVNRSKIILKDWERGAGATGSSGTGAAASVVAGVVNAFLNRQVEVIFPLGSLTIDWRESDDDICLTGPVEFICTGEFLHSF